jgi:hypothetical protein
MVFEFLGLIYICIWVFVSCSQLLLPSFLHHRESCVILENSYMSC